MARGESVKQQCFSVAGVPGKRGPGLRSERRRESHRAGGPMCRRRCQSLVPHAWEPQMIYSIVRCSSERAPVKGAQGGGKALGTLSPSC